jgi:hypothetical protein
MTGFDSQLPSALPLEKDRYGCRGLLLEAEPDGGTPPSSVRERRSPLPEFSEPQNFHTPKNSMTPLVTPPMDADPSSALGDPEQGQRPTVKPCSRCQSHPRIPGQRWCRSCLTEYARLRRYQQRAALKDVTQVPTPAKEPVTPGSGPQRAVIEPSVLICGAEAPGGFPPGCGLPFRPRVPWRPYYCCNGCGSRHKSHTEECPVESVPVEAARD